MVAEIWDPFVAPCPIGPIKLLGVVQGRLLLAGGMESIYTLELSHPAIRARMLIQGGTVKLDHPPTFCRDLFSLTPFFLLFIVKLFIFGMIFFL